MWIWMGFAKGKFSFCTADIVVLLQRDWQDGYGYNMIPTKRLGWDRHDHVSRNGKEAFFG
jgi:hypothetical protein